MMTNEQYVNNFNEFININNIHDGTQLRIVYKPIDTPCDYLKHNTDRIVHNINDIITVDSIYNYLGVIGTIPPTQYAIYSYEYFTGSLDKLILPNQNCIIKQYKQKKVIKSKPNCFKANIIDNKIVLGNMIVTSKGNKVSNGRLYNHIKLVGI